MGQHPSPHSAQRGALLRRPAALRLIAAAVLTILLTSGCGTRTIQGGSTASAGRVGQLGDVATSPLNDFNLNQVEIPPILKVARAQPYATPAGMACAPMLTEVMNLDAALGPDVDAAAVGPDGKSLTDASTEAVGDAAVGAFRSTVENLVPFRGWVRRLSGANQYEREVAAALAAGMARRAFLKGLMQANGCLKKGEKMQEPPPAPPAGPYIPPLPTR